MLYKYHLTHTSVTSTLSPASERHSGSRRWWWSGSIHSIRSKKDKGILDTCIHTWVIKISRIRLHADGRQIVLIQQMWGVRNEMCVTPQQFIIVACLASWGKQVILHPGCHTGSKQQKLNKRQNIFWPSLMPWLLPFLILEVCLWPSGLMTFTWHAGRGRLSKTSSFSLRLSRGRAMITSSAKVCFPSSHFFACTQWACDLKKVYQWWR